MGVANLTLLGDLEVGVGGAVGGEVGGGGGGGGGSGRFEGGGGKEAVDGGEE